MLGLCAALVLISLFRAVGLAAGPWLAVPLAAALSLPIAQLAFTLRHSPIRPGAPVFAGAACAIAAGIVLFTPDTSWDGMAYHFPSVLSIASGWNPLRGPSEIAPANLYPNGAWTLLAATGTLVGSLDGGRALKLLVLAISACLLSRLLSSWIERPRRRLLLTAAVIANPVVTAQLWTFYLDDLIYLLTLCSFCLCVEFLRNPRLQTVAPLSASVILLSLTKLYGAYYAGVAILAAIACVGFRPCLSAARLGVPALILTLALSGFIGWRPFVTGWAEGDLVGPLKGHPIRQEAPANLRHIPGPLAFPVSMASATGGRRAEPVQLKAPFTVTVRELYFMAAPDPRAGGFGPFYSGACLLALALWGGALGSWAWVANSLRVVLAGISVSAIILAGCMAFPVNWWARLVPIGWILPLVPVVIAERLCRADRGWWKWMSVALIALCLADGALALIGNAGRTLYRWWDVRSRVEMVFEDAAAIGLTPDPGGWMHMTVTYWIERLGYEVRLVEPGACGSAGLTWRRMQFCEAP